MGNLTATAIFHFESSKQRLKMAQHVVFFIRSGTGRVYDVRVKDKTVNHLLYSLLGVKSDQSSYLFSPASSH